MNFKKRVNGSWTDTPYYIHNTSTDTITTLPAVIHPTDTTATVGLKGQMLQSSVPSPTSPIMPQGCGDLETSGAKAGQYKIPISSANTTTPVYLGEVETTRRIKKLVLTGNESYTKNDADSTHYLYYGGRGALLPNSIEKTPLLCNELPVTSGAPQSQVGISSNNNFNVVYLNFGADVMNAQTSGNIVKGLKEYLAAQYAAGTPVTVWYALAEPTTGIVNEPLRKIGDYADEVSGIIIPTIAGANTLSIGTALQPSEVTVNYKGWHPVQSAHERENGAWT